MKKILCKYALVIFALALLSGCGSTPVFDGGLFEDLYSCAKNGNYQDSTAALIMLSNMDLSIDEISRIKSGYINEKDEEKRLHYVYVLAKRTQEQRYIDQFVDSAAMNQSFVIKNDSRWVSIVSPLYQMLAYYSKGSDGDKALAAIMRLIDDADGVVLGSIADDLYAIYSLNPERLIRIANQENIDMNKIKYLFDQE